MEHAATWLARALADCRTTGDTAMVLQLATLRARVLWESGRRDEGIEEVRTFVWFAPYDGFGDADPLVPCARPQTSVRPVDERPPARASIK